MKCKLIAFDLDGTFLRDDKSIPPENMAVLEKAAAQGIHIVPSSGRIYPGIPPELKEAPFIRYYICGNGASIYDRFSDRTIYRAEIPNALALRCVEHMRTLGTAYDCYQNEWGYMNRDILARLDRWIPDPGLLNHVKSIRTPVDDLYTMLRENGGSVMKLQLYFDNFELRAKEMEILPKLFPELIASSSVHNNIEINSANATKGQAMQMLCTLLGFSASEAAAIGDGSNDADMVTCAGIGVAMGNSCDALLSLADLVTKSNMDLGFALAVENILAQSI